MKTILRFMLVLALAVCIAPVQTFAQCDPGFLPGSISITTDDYPYETSFEIKDACTGAVLFSSGPLFDANTTYTLDFCAMGNFEFVIYDSFGDGICCDWGLGSYSVTFDGVLVGSGGMFGSSESVFFGNGAPCPPGPLNDECEGAKTISCGETISGTTVGASTETQTFCGTSITTAAVWYKFTGDGSVVTLSTCSFGNFDTKISVFSGSCGSLTCVGGNDDFCGLLSTVSACTEAGTDYYVLVHAFGNAWGDFELSLTCNEPVNPGIIFGPGAVCSGGSAYLELFGNTAGVDLQWQESGTSGGSYTAIAGETFPYYFNPSVTQDAYYVVVATCGSSSATTDEAAVLVALPPANDNICNAQALILGVVTPFNNMCATVETGEQSPGPGSSCNAQDGWCPFETGLQNTVWFKFTTPASKAVTIRSAFNAIPFDTQLALWAAPNGCSGTLVKVAANDDTQNPIFFFDFSSEILPVYCLQPNATYYVQVDGFFGTVGPGAIIVEEVTDKKVLVCHRTGNGRTQTLSVSGCALAAHLAHGDTRGSCGSAKTDETILEEADLEEVNTGSFIQAYPNPFNDKTSIEFGITQASDNVRLEIFSVNGQLITTLFEGSMGENETKRIEFNASDMNSGVFVYVLKTGSEVNIGKLNVIR